MAISGIDPPGVHPLSIDGVPRRDSPTQAGPEIASQQEALIQAAPGADDSADDRGAAVLRLLQAGHFKGVADVRLRINFHEQIVAAETAAATAAADEAVRNLSGAVNARLDQPPSSLSASEEQLAALAELRKTFDEALDNAAETFLGAQAPEGEALKQGLREAFDSLAASLDSLFLANNAEQPQGPDADAETTAEFQAWMAALREDFEAAMSGLNDALASRSYLPELSSPTGRGVAFEKFLAIYSQMQGLEQTPLPDPQETLSAEA